MMTSGEHGERFGAPAAAGTLAREIRGRQATFIASVPVPTGQTSRCMNDEEREARDLALSQPERPNTVTSNDNFNISQPSRFRNSNR